MKKPYLLAPCGCFEAVKAAMAAGADECYLGGNIGNARMNAKGFSDEEFRNALKLMKLHGVRSNITLNTLNFDKELKNTVEFAKKAWDMGADAFIVQDLGLAKLLYEEIPNVELHASTQCACHNLDGAIELSKLGFSRIVLARELSKEDIKNITEYGNTVGNFETEAFVHGALCVCHSGMCLMSSVIGKRSGNRGLCAQPCRMSGTLKNCHGKKKENFYPLSLKDLSLSKHITELLPLGIASLKIEGRMKSPEYVYSTVRIFRALLDSCANADKNQYEELADIFSRGGFTDGYFTKKYLSDNKKMYGFRSENDKSKTSAQKIVIPDIPKIPIKLYAKIAKDELAFVRFEHNGRFGEYATDAPSTAKNAPLTVESFVKNISKLGATDFCLAESNVELDDGLFLTSAEINSLRRGAIENLENRILSARNGKFGKRSLCFEEINAEIRSCKTQKLRFITDNPYFTYDKNKYYHELESVCLPAELFKSGKITDIKLPFGVRLPRVIFSCEKENVIKAVENAKESGARYAYISNIGHVEIARIAKLPLYGGIGLNVTNSEAFFEYAKMGFECITLSAELNSAQMRDIKKVENVKSAATVYGRLPLMVLESCILQANGICENYSRKNSLCGEYTDRIGKKFQIYPERRFGKNGEPCRNIILNADVLNLYFKEEEIKKCGVEILEIITDN